MDFDGIFLELSKMVSFMKNDKVEQETAQKVTKNMSSATYKISAILKNGRNSLHEIDFIQKLRETLPTTGVLMMKVQSFQRA
jgi:hypothetical protein